MAVCTKFAPQYAVTFMTALVEKILSKAEKKPSVLWRYIRNAFFVRGHDEKLLKEFINEIYSFIQQSNLQQIGQKKNLIF